MSAAKVTMSAASLGFALLFGGGLYLYMNMGSIAEKLAEKYASEALGVAVNIGSVDVSLQERRVTVNGIKIDNPSGYTGAHAATVGQVHITAGDLSAELLQFKDVSVNDADIYLEVTPNGTNLSDIRNNLNRNAGKNPSAGEKAVKVILDKLVMNGTIHPSVTIADITVEAFTMPPLTLHNIGGSNGAPVGEAIAQIWVPLSRQVIQAANKQGLLQGLNEDALKEVGVSKVQEIKDKIGTEVEAIGEGLKGLLGGN